MVAIKQFSDMCYIHCLYNCVFHQLQSWPDDALTIVAQRFLDEVEMDDSVKDGCVEMCKEFHQTTRKLSERYLATLQRHNYVTPTSYLELISTYKTLLSMKRRCCEISMHTHIHTPAGSKQQTWGAASSILL